MAGMKGLDWQPYEIPLTKGVNTAHDKRSLPAAQLATCENAVFDDDGGIQKAPGRIIVSTVLSGAGATATKMADIKALMAYRDELLIVDDNQVYSRAPAAGLSGDAAETSLGVVPRGRYESVRTERETVRAYVTGSGAYTDRAENGGVEVYAWGDGTVYYRVIDQATGAILTDRAQTDVYEDQAIANATAPKVRAVGSFIHVYYVDTTGSPRSLKEIIIDPADIDNTINAGPILLANALVSTGSQYDVDVAASGSIAHIAYRNSSDTYTILHVKEDGFLSFGAKIKARACLGAIAVSVNTNAGKVLVARVDSPDAVDGVRADWLDSSDHDDGSTVNISVEAGIDILHLACTAHDGGETGFVFYDSLDGTSYWKVKRATVTTTAALKMLVRHSKIASRAIVSDDNRALMHVVLATGSQQTQYVLLDCEYAVGEEQQGEETRLPGDEVGLLARLLPGEAVLQTVTVAHLPQIERTATDTYKWAPKSQRLLSVSDARLYNGTMRAEIGLKNFTYTFGDARSYDAVAVGQSLYIPGGFLAQYDGRRVTESGFFVYPEIDNTAMTETVSATTADILTDGASYTYRLYWEWRNDRGEVEQSTFAGEITKTFTGGAPDTYTIVVPTLPYTMKTNVVLAVYRSQPNPQVGDPFNRVSGPASQGTGAETYLENDPNTDTISWQDENFTDATALSNELDYQNTGELDNVACPAPPLALSAGQARVFWVSPEADDTVNYSKLAQPGKLVAHNEALTLPIPHLGGKVIAIAPGEDSVVVLKERGIYLLAGQGPDNLGAGDYGLPQLVNSGIGCDEARSVARIPDGLVFHSDKGWFLLDRGYQLHDIGRAADDFDDRAITGVIVNTAEHRFVVLSSSGDGSYCYDYRVGQWSDWPVLDDVVDGAMSQGLAYYLEPSSLITVETPAAWAQPLTYVPPAETYGGYSTVVDTGWISFDQLIGYTRAKKWQLLGGWHGAQSFDVRVRVAYGYDDTWVDDLTFTIDGTDETAGLPLRLGQRFTRGKLGAVRIRIEDIERSGGSGTWGEALRLTAIGIELGFRRGQYRLPARQTT